MIEPEVAWMELPGLLELEEGFVSYIVQTVLEKRRAELEVLERDVSKLESVAAPFPLGAEGSTIVCENHGSTFSLDGAVTKGPARRSLPRYAMRKDDKGNVIVDTSKSFNEDKWQDAEAFINA